MGTAGSEKGGLMLEMIMKLNIPLYVMTSMGCIGGLGMLATNLTYRRMIRNTQRLQNLKEKWLNLWKSRDRLWHRMNRFVWYPSLLCTFLLVLSVILNSRLEPGKGLPMLYLYIGAAVPVTLLLLRQGLDFSYKEELVMASLADYVEQVRTWVEEIPVPRRQILFCRKRSWIGSQGASVRLRQQEAISARCFLRRRKRS